LWNARSARRHSRRALALSRSGPRAGLAPGEPTHVQMALALLDGGDVELQLDLLAHQQVAAAERLVEGHVPVAAVQLAVDLEAHALVAPRVGLGALDVCGELDRLRDAVHRQ